MNNFSVISFYSRPVLRATTFVLYCASTFSDYLASDIAFAQDTASPEIVIEGKGKERKSIQRPGQSTVIRPNEETRFDFQTQLKSDPSISVSNQGRSSGFSLPLFRGQDARSTHIYIDDIELQDPFSGLPMVDEIDLRSFGVVTIHKGFAPWDIPVLEAGGVIQFSKRKSSIVGHRVESGLAHGSVTGTSGWLKGSHQTETTDASLYGRRSFSKGNYPIYNDQGTVLNSTDDSISLRKNNDRSSHQGLANLEWDSSSLNANNFVWAQQSRQGIPIASAHEHNQARSRNATYVGSSTLRYYLNTSSTLGANFGIFRAQRIFTDPSSAIGFASKRTLESQSIRAKAFYRYEQEHLHWIASMEHANATSKLDSNYALDYFSPKAKTQKAFFGAKILYLSTQVIEVKANAEKSEYSTQSFDGSIVSPQKITPSSSQSIAWSKDVDAFVVYMQVGKSTRFPSLLERLGNGAEIEGSASLNPERTQAAEAGLKFQRNTNGLSTQFGLTFWGRNNAEVIRIERISANRWRANNAKEQFYRGIEARSEIGMCDFNVELAVSGIQARTGKQQLLVPRVPIWQAAGGFSYKLSAEYMARSQSRFAGRMYDDYSNTRELGWSLVHDISLDYTSSTIPVKAGVSFNNITNHMSSTVVDTTTKQADGRMAYSGYNGEPHTGRSFTASVSVSL